MTYSNQDNPPREIDQLTTSIREMANRVGAQFVIDNRKAENYVAASEQRQPRVSDSGSRSS